MGDFQCLHIFLLRMKARIVIACLGMWVCLCLCKNMCYKGMQMIQLWKNHLKPRKEDDDWEFGILEKSSLGRSCFWNYLNFFNAELLSGNGSFRKSAILDLVPSLNLWYWWREATYTIFTPIRQEIVAFLLRLFQKYLKKYLLSEEDLKMYFWIFFEDLQLNSESHQT